MLETHIVMSFLIFRLALSLTLCLTLLLVLFLSSLMDLTITHMVLDHERTALSLDALVTAHILIVVIVFRVAYFSCWRVLHPLKPRHLNDPHFPCHGLHPTQPSVVVVIRVRVITDRHVTSRQPSPFIKLCDLVPSLNPSFSVARHAALLSR
jgi:hypothetical protein